MIRVKCVSRSMTNRRVFRTLARENCGESMEPGEDEQMYFGYMPDDYSMKGNVIACASLKMADEQCTCQNDKNFYHYISFLFVHKYYKRLGYGTQIVDFLEIEAWNRLKRPIRVESARKAVDFFRRCQYATMGEPKETFSGSGSSLFRVLQLMQKQCNYILKEEEWG